MEPLTDIDRLHRTIYHGLERLIEELARIAKSLENINEELDRDQ